MGPYYLIKRNYKWEKIKKKMEKNVPVAPKILELGAWSL